MCIQCTCTHCTCMCTYFVLPSYHSANAAEWSWWWWYEETSVSNTHVHACTCRCLICISHGLKCLHACTCVQWGAVWETGKGVQKKVCCSTYWWAKKMCIHTCTCTWICCLLPCCLWSHLLVSWLWFHLHVGLDSIPEGLEAVLDVTDQSSPAYLRAKKKLEEYLPFETQLVNFHI